MYGENDDEEGIKSDLHIVNTWRPRQVTPLDRLKRHFLGGSQIISNNSYFAPSHYNKVIDNLMIITSCMFNFFTLYCILFFSHIIITIIIFSLRKKYLSLNYIN